MLKRKNEESEESKNTTHVPKRVALDAEAVEQKDIQDDKEKTSVSLTNNDNTDSNDQVMKDRSPNQDNDVSNNTNINNNQGDDDDNNNNNSNDTSDNNDENVNHNNTNNNNNNVTPSSIPSKDDFANNTANEYGPISSHKVVQNDDPTYVHFRMLASVSDTANIVGKGGESISKIKEESNARVNVSENLKGVPERVISVRGSAEYVAKAFGLIVRTINNEPFGQSSNIDSKPYNLRLLFPHTIMGYIIGKKGARFREIEENSAASLKANDQILPASTDRILNISGVADAIHIATYYVAQTVIEHKQQITKSIYYNPANHNQPSVPALSMNQNNMANNQRFGYNNQGQNNMMMPVMYNPNQMKIMNPQMQFNGVPNNGMNMGMMNNQTNLISPTANTNSRPGETITTADGKVNQELYVSQTHIGLVIGRGGKNLKDIRQNTGCYVKVNDEIPGAPERKLTLIGNIYGIQNAIVLINNKIENEKQRKQRDANGIN